jgi:hypothetical protein
MPLPFRAHRRRFASPPARRARLTLEMLESRLVPSAGPATLDQAAPLVLNWSGPVGGPAHVGLQTAGTVGNGSGPTADVDWYTFTLDRAAAVTLSATSAQGAVLSLYNSDGLGDFYDPLGHRLVAQAQGSDASLTPLLGQGTYYVAVSGLGNKYFHPYLADSGYAGIGGPFQLTLGAVALSAPVPDVVRMDALPDAADPNSLSRSPQEVYLALSGPLDPVVASSLNVQLTAAGGGTNLLSSFNYSDTAHELQLQLTAPLGPGAYQVTVADNLDPVPALAPYSGTFTVTGIEGNTANPAPDNTGATAHQLQFANGFTQITGAIGDDSTDPTAFDPNSVEAYHFQVTQPGHYALVAEAFAGRIGSPLTPGLSLFQVVNGQLSLVTFNGGTFNGAQADAASPVATPLSGDPVLYAALTTPGDYFLVVSEANNQPDPFAGPSPYDPTGSFGGQFLGGGFTWGNFVLNVSLQEQETPPQVVSVHPLDGGPLAQPPTTFVVQFSEAVNLQQLLYQNGSGDLSAVTIDGTGGTYTPRLVSYDPGSYQATFVMLNRLAPGTYTLHLQSGGPNGITDLAGNPLGGSTHDYVQTFTVTGAGRSTNLTEQSNDAVHPQDLGVLAPFELQDTVVVTGAFTDASGTAYYQFRVLQSRNYQVTVGALPQGSITPPGNWVTLTDATTNTPVPALLQGLVPPDGSSQVNSSGFIHLLTFFNAGDTYVLAVRNWGSGPYDVRLANANTPEAPPPLTVGAAPAIQQRLRGPGAPPGDPPPTPPAGPGPSGPPPAFVSTTGPAGKSEGGPAVPVPLPNGVLLGLGTGPRGGSGAPAADAHVPDIFELVFARSAPSSPDTTQLGSEQYADTWDYALDDFFGPSPSPQGPGGVPRSGADTGLWRWMAKHLGGWWSLSLDMPGAPRLDGADVPEPRGPGAGAEGDEVGTSQDEPGNPDVLSAVPLTAFFALVGGLLRDVPDSPTRARARVRLPRR